MTSARILAVVALVLLGGCASMFAPDWSIYAPDVSNATQFAADSAWCQQAATAKPRKLDGGGIVAAAGEGVKQNVASPEIGAAVGIAGQAAETIGVTHNNIRSAYVDCVRRKTDKDESAFVMEN